jgi:hypothetical protein
MAVIHWNGSDLREALRSLPAGDYVVAPVETAPLLSPEEEECLIEALASMRAGHGVEHEQVRSRSRSRSRWASGRVVRETKGPRRALPLGATRRELAHVSASFTP